MPWSIQINVSWSTLLTGNIQAPEVRVVRIIRHKAALLSPAAGWRIEMRPAASVELCAAVRDNIFDKITFKQCRAGVCAPRGARVFQRPAPLSHVLKRQPAIPVPIVTNFSSPSVDASPSVFRISARP